jgi:diguanylate cyclase (GGDEF)-like protein
VSLIELPFYEHEMRLRHKNGGWIWTLDRGKVVVWGNDGKPLIMSGAHQDITARKQAEEKIQHMANHDGLTDLPSLRLARDRLSMAMSLARRNKTMAAVMFLDLDGFKAVNDTFGHEAGDEVIKEVAKRLRSSVRETDTVARIGGDEFLLVITELKSTPKMAGIAEKVIRILSEPIFYKCVMATVGVSIGIAIFPRDGANVDYLIQLADEAMYKVKASGKSGYKYANAKLGPRRPRKYIN